MIVSESTKRFTGKERDEGMGMDNFLARYYSAPVGRFTSPDAPFADQGAEDPQSWNLYSYVRSNPLIFTDRDGRKCVKRLNEDGDACFEIDVKPKEKPDVKLDSDLFLAVARGVSQAAPVVEGAAAATAVVVTVPVQAAATIVVIDGVAYTLQALLALGPEALAQLVAAGKLSQEVLAKLMDKFPQLGWRGGEVRVGKNLRINFFGDWKNKGAAWFARIPHYHRRIIDPVNGKTVPGGGMDWHRPWESSGKRPGFWGRF